MNTSLQHLPKEKQDLIQHVVKIIIERIEPEKIILYGSYATGKWVEDEYYEGNTQYDYKSDYDFLVITKSGERLPDHEVQEILERRSGLNNIISTITHDIDYVNGKLSDGQYFFSDIKKEGVLLYDAGNVPLAEQRELSNPEKKAIAQNDFDIWFASGRDFLEGCKFYFQKGSLKIATFELHQSAERLLNTIILVFRGYKPKTHNLEKLFRYAKHFSKEIIEIFPRNTSDEVRLFDLLKKGYVEARYDRHFTITPDELSSLITKVERLLEVTERICLEKIVSM